MEKNLGLEQAQSMLNKSIMALNTEWVSLWDARGRVLAASILAPDALPSKAQSAVDGYALGTAEAPVDSSFEIRGELKQDEVAEYALLPGEAVLVLTGGVVPAGTGAVVPHERTDVVDDRLLVREKIKPGNNIKQAGEDFRQGELLAASDARIGPGLIALLAAYGFKQIEVYRKPTAAVVSLGANIVAHETQPAPGQVRDSNGPMLAAMICQAGGEVLTVEVAANAEKKALISHLKVLLDQSDLLILTGGSYAPENCEALKLMEEMGADILYWDVAVQPGSHQGTGRLDKKLVLSLSGNPAACAVGFHLFAAPVIRMLQGLPELPGAVTARCSNGFPKAAATRRLVRGYLSVTEEGWVVEVLPGQKPSMFRSLINYNALIDLPAGSLPVKSGEEVAVRLIAPK